MMQHLSFAASGLTITALTKVIDIDMGRRFRFFDERTLDGHVGKTRKRPGRPPYIFEASGDIHHR